MSTDGVTRKRPRTGQASPIDLTGPEVGQFEEINSARALRADLTLRSSESTLHLAFAGAAHVGGATGGALNTDTFLCQLGQAVAAALRTVAATTETARMHLRSMRATLHAAIDARCDDLEAGLSRAESTKTAALERELVAVDAALERWRCDTRVVQEAVVTSSDAELISRHAELFARLEGLEAQLRALPTAPVEPPHVGLTMDTPALLASIASAGRIVAPLAISASDVTLEGVPSHVRPGQNLQLHLALGDRHADQSTEELELSLGALAAAVRCEVALCSHDVQVAVSVPASVIPCSVNRGVLVAVTVPQDSPRGSYLTVVALLFDHHMFSRPVTISVHCGLYTPLQLMNIGSVSPCISTDGRLYVPLDQTLAVIDADGSELPSIPAASLGAHCIYRGAWSNAATQRLLLAGDDGLVAVDPSTLVVQWTIRSTLVWGISVLPGQGVAVVSDAAGLNAYRLLDGSLTGRVSEDIEYCFVAADSASMLVFASLRNPPFAVDAWSWVPSSDGVSPEGTLAPLGPVAAAGERESTRVLAVMPPAARKRISHLLVGTYHSSELLVLSLPGLALVHTHRLEGVQHIKGLAADPWGTALAVCDHASNSTHALAWPLPGMPQLE